MKHVRIRYLQVHIDVIIVAAACVDSPHRDTRLLNIQVLSRGPADNITLTGPDTPLDEISILVFSPYSLYMASGPMFLSCIPATTSRIEP